MINILYAGKLSEQAEYDPCIRTSLKKRGIEFNLQQSFDDPMSVDYIVYSPHGTLTDFTPFKNAKLVQNLWAGVEVPLANDTLTQPLARMVEQGLTHGMADYVMAHVLRHHMFTDVYAAAQPGDWREDLVPPLAMDRTVGILGLGALGSYAANKLKYQGFNVMGWSRSQKELKGIDCRSGSTGLTEVLAGSDYLVLLLPNTPDTYHVINSKTIAGMKQGAAIINPGRGPLINDGDLLAALDSGCLSGATLDVFDQEPLDKTHAYWTHPKVLVTPHIASATRADTSAETVAENIARGETGKPFLHLVDKSAGY